MKIKYILPVVLCLIVLLPSLSYSQYQNQDYKFDAQRLMQKGLYGEAIDQLNKYIAAFPQQADGYNLRGICYEKQQQYDYAVYNFRNAAKIEPLNTDISDNLKRTENEWYTLLYNNIEGYKRELAINPNLAQYYLKIGKCFKDMGDWKKAEEWYDEYLKREEPSPDEVIRYTEILARNNQIKKGEIILKKFVEKYPDDQRLWSRYGYFTMWLGNKKTAIEAFKKALSIKPFFKEAINGLDLAEGKGYIYTFNDTVTYKRYGTIPHKKPFIYPIDKYYIILKNHPLDNEIRKKLIIELNKHNRFYEALQQLEILSKDSSYSDFYYKYKTIAVSCKDSLLELRISKLEEEVSKNPSDKKLVAELADDYANKMDYDKALDILDKYFSTLPNGDISDMRFRYAKYAAWDYKFDQAMQQLKVLLYNDPNNLEYKLLRAQISVWVDQNLTQAEEDLKLILEKEPKNFKALISLASLEITKDSLDEAKHYIDLARNLKPESKELESVQNYYDAQVSAEKGRKIYDILYSARKLAAANKCKEAVQKYEEYFSKITAPTKLEEEEYLNTTICAEEYKKTISESDMILGKGYDFDIALLRAKANLLAGDSTEALSEFQKLATEQPSNFDANLYLAVANERMHQYDEAGKIYKQMLTTPLDSSQKAIVIQRKKWLASSMYNPSFIYPFFALNPYFYYYADNQDFQILDLNGRLELGVTSFLSLGLLYQNAGLQSDVKSRHINKVEGQAYIKFVPDLTLSGGYGVLDTTRKYNEPVYDASLNFNKGNVVNLIAYYEHNDARLLLYSPFILDQNLTTDLYRFTADLLVKSKLKLYGTYSRIKVSDGNAGNNLTAKIGYKIIEPVFAGYQFDYINYKKPESIYYSPKNYFSNSVWVDWLLLKDKDVSLDAGGRFGNINVANLNYTLYEINSKLSFNATSNLLFNFNLSAGSSTKFDQKYNYFSTYFSLYWSF